MAAGYSGTPLWKKLGIRPGQRLAVVDAPENYAELVSPLPEGAMIHPDIEAPAPFIHGFVSRLDDLERQLPGWAEQLAKEGMLWISWPKKAAKMTTDVDGNKVRAAGLATGLVDVKVCAVDATWSGLKFVVRLQDR